MGFFAALKGLSLPTPLSEWGGGNPAAPLLPTCAPHWLYQYPAEASLFAGWERRVGGHRDGDSGVRGTGGWVVAVEALCQLLPRHDTYRAMSSKHRIRSSAK